MGQMGVNLAEIMETGRGQLGAFFNGEAVLKASHFCARCGHLRVQCDCHQDDDDNAAPSSSESTSETNGEVSGADHFGLPAGYTSPYQRTLNLIPGFPEKALRRMARAIDAAAPEDLPGVLADAKHVYDLLLLHKHDEQAAALKEFCINHGSKHFDAPEPDAEITPDAPQALPGTFVAPAFLQRRPF